jgi:tRNA-specific 2-thiouridylase
MPVGDYEKSRIRRIAEEIGLAVAHKPDSMEICFVPDQDYAKFIRDNSGCEIPEGNFVTTDGTVIGRHKGITHYTVGQRKGLNLSMGHPVFVVEIRPETNEVVIGDNSEVFTDRLICTDLNYMSVPDFPYDFPVVAKIRYNHQGTKARIRKIDEDRAEVLFDEPVRAVTPGQAVVFYDGEYVAGGGTILRS